MGGLLIKNILFYYSMHTLPAEWTQLILSLGLLRDAILLEFFILIPGFEIILFAAPDRLDITY